MSKALIFLWTSALGQNPLNDKLSGRAFAMHAEHPSFNTSHFLAGLGENPEELLPVRVDKIEIDRPMV